MKKLALISTVVAAIVVLSGCSSSSKNVKSDNSGKAQKVNSSASSNKNNVSNDKDKTSSDSSNSKAESNKANASTDANGDYIIKDINSWNHPVKNILNRENIKINKVVLQNNKTYPIFYVTFSKELNTDNKEYYGKLMKEIALANGYWNFEIVDEGRNADIKVKCKDKKSVDSISYNKDSSYFALNSVQSLSKEQELVNYLVSNVSEVRSFMNVHANNTNSKSTIYVERYPNAAATNTYEKNYYMIYVGESFPDHIVNTYRFAINKDTNEILYYDTAKDKYETLTEWRNSKN